MRSPNRSFNRAANTGVNEISGTSSNACWPRRFAAPSAQRIDRRLLFFRNFLSLEFQNYETIEANTDGITELLADCDHAGVAKPLNRRAGECFERVLQKQRALLQFFHEWFIRC